MASLWSIGLINLIRLFPDVLMISSTANVTLFSSYFELILTRAVQVVFFYNINIKLTEYFNNFLSYCIVLLSKLIAVLLLSRKPLDARKCLITFQKCLFSDTPFEEILLKYILFIFLFILLQKFFCFLKATKF